MKFTHFPRPWLQLFCDQSQVEQLLLCDFQSTPLLLRLWHCTFIPRRDLSEVCWHRCTSATPVCCHVDTGRAANTTRHTWWLRLPSGSGTCLECPAVVCQGRSIVAAVPPGIEDDTVSCVLRLKTALQLLLTICDQYANIWDIKFNPAKSQIITFGGKNPQGSKWGTPILGWEGEIPWLVYSM